MTLLLVHGSGLNPSYWDRVQAQLTGIPVVAPALPGRLGAEWPARAGQARDMAAYAEAIAAVMDGEGIEKAVIAGQSLGGGAALELALRYPERVAGLALICTGARLRVLARVLEGLADDVKETFDGMVNANFGPKAADRDRVAMRRMFESTGTAQTYQDLAACNGFDQVGRLGEIRCPALVIVGENDVVTPPKYGELLATSIRGSRLVSLDETGHGLVLERPEEVAAELAVFWAASMPREKAARTRQAAKTGTPRGSG